MSDKITITIDCDLGEAFCRADDQLDFKGAWKPAETTRSELIAYLLTPHIKELMKCSKEELQKRHIEMLCK